MGLLTDPRAGTGKIIKLLLKWEKPLCFTLYVGGVMWLMLLALPAFNDSTFPRDVKTSQIRNTVARLGDLNISCINRTFTF